ncbi:hypothetical protein [Spirochaeta lutea]|uniref:Uncharacterized protein n=1 Tax=Spirochaeta lutea TaxID=1480694 RepID=A0A098QVE6_9SPIO|nr:hypothetical protein [Spirochaeta lutea]KGE71343.1 hypothetical protein DC28_11055 [Spirochaeta lutea]
MKSSKILKERIRRIEILLKELGYDVEPDELPEMAGYSAGVFQGEQYILSISVDQESRFLELGFTFGFSNSLHERIRSSMEDLLGICYEYGNYLSIQTLDPEITISIFSKIYFSGLNYYALKESVRDLRASVRLIKELFQIHDHLVGDEYGNS